MLSTIIWDPDRNFFIIPYINHPVTWYGFFFALGFLVGYFLMRRIFARFLADPSKFLAETKLAAVQLTDRLTVFVVLGTIIGARLGHVFFYGWPYYRSHPLDIFKIWEGGLASHGGAIGVLIGLWIFILWSRRDYPRITFLSILDALVVPAAFVGGCIRIGNFINQEITGIPTDLPWGVAFMRPLDGIPGVPVHPVQLYESAVYFLVFVVLYLLWRYNLNFGFSFLSFRAFSPTSRNFHPRKGPKAIHFGRKFQDFEENPSESEEAKPEVQVYREVGTGFLSGWFFLLVFSARFVIEFLKMPQSSLLDSNTFLSMGQILSIPFIVLGISLLIYSHFKHAKR